MKCSIEETKQMLEDYYNSIDIETMLYDIEDNMAMMVMEQLHLPEDEAYDFVIDWFDKRH